MLFFKRFVEKQLEKKKGQKRRLVEMMPTLLIIKELHTKCIKVVSVLLPSMQTLILQFTFMRYQVFIALHYHHYPKWLVNKIKMVFLDIQLFSNDCLLIFWGCTKKDFTIYNKSRNGTANIEDGVLRIQLLNTKNTIVSLNSYKKDNCMSKQSCRKRTKYARSSLLLQGYPSKQL